MPKMVNPLFFEYQLKCQHPGCFGTRRIEQAETAGWTQGQIIPEDASHPDVGRCFVCKRHQMKVMNAPPPPKPIPSKGWTKIPTE